MNKNEYLVTKEGLEKLNKQLDELSGPIRKELVNVVEEMRSKGDLSENDGYTLAIERSQSNEATILELKEKIDNAKVVSSANSVGVSLGDTVTVKGDDDVEKTYEIVSENEANPMEGKISHKSPLGEAMIGKKKGNSFTFTTPGGDMKYEIVSC